MDPDIIHAIEITRAAEEIIMPIIRATNTSELL